MRGRLPIGIENFKEIRNGEFYYVDKTGMIKELATNWGKVNLFTRPRRFGKSLNMSMLRYFFEPDSDKDIFDGLAISRETQICEKYMGKYPVIAISLKGISAGSYETARDMAVRIICEEARKHQYLLESCRLTPLDKEAFQLLLQPDMKEAVLCGSLRELSYLLKKHYGQKVIILIDEYDVPLAKAFEQDYYDEMVLLIRNMFEQAFKTNDSLQFAVLTGCLRIAKESIFTGLNNLKVLSVAEVEYQEYFGFTDREVRDLLEYYEQSDAYDAVKEWYDGYRFGNADIYCPWDVMNYCDLMRTEPDAEPRGYWTNTSSNDVVRHFIENSRNVTVRQEIERLVAGETVTKKIRTDLTYRELYRSADNLWSVLFMTGYLTQQGRPKDGLFRLVIPNMEIRKVFTEQIMEFFAKSIRKDGKTVERFCEAVKSGDAEEVEKQFGMYLKKTISIRDTFVKKKLKENYYHGILMGLFAYKESWAVFSNRESGDGYSDILIEIEDEEIGIVMEVKYLDGISLEEGCRKALEQIEANRYAQRLLDDGMRKVLKYGIACYKKTCRVELAYP